jgi:uncharacterized protein YndB with AHSA1/START domain
VSRVRVSIVIDAPPEKVWGQLQDIDTHAEWMQDAEAIRFTSDQRQGVGTTFVADTRFGPLSLSDPMEVTEWDEPRSMGIRHGGAVTGTGLFRLEPVGGDRTRFVWEEELAFPWWMGGPLGAAVGGQVLKVVWRRNLANLKRRVESA